MAHRDDFTMNIEAGQTAMCDVCTALIAVGETRIRTYIGIGSQSDVCMDCANLITSRMSAPGPRVTKGGSLRPERVIRGAILTV